MRKLRTSDIPKAARLLKSLGIRDKFQKVAQEANTAEDVFDPGFDFIWDLFDIATEQAGESAIYEFLAGPFEMNAQEIADLNLDVLIDNMKQLVRENNLSDFFKSVAALKR